MTLQHTVLFAFPEELDESEARELFERVGRWPEEIGGIDAIRLGQPIDSSRARGFQYLLHMELPGAEALASYQRHPAHQAFSAWVLAKGCTVLAFDYLLDSETVLHPRTGAAGARAPGRPTGPSRSGG